MGVYVYVTTALAELWSMLVIAFIFNTACTFGKACAGSLLIGDVVVIGVAVYVNVDVMIRRTSYTLGSAHSFSSAEWIEMIVLAESKRDGPGDTRVGFAVAHRRSKI